MGDSFYNSTLWRQVADRAKARDGHRCSVNRLLSGPCRGALHAHHIVPRAEGGPLYDLDNIATVCAGHHPQWEALRRTLMKRRQEPTPRCPHHHQTAEGRAQCEARMARRRGLSFA